MTISRIRLFREDPDLIDRILSPQMLFLIMTADVHPFAVATYEAVPTDMVMKNPDGSITFPTADGTIVWSARMYYVWETKRIIYV